MITFKKKNYIAYISIGIPLIILFILFEVFDKKISMSFSHKIQDWFTIFFDNFATFNTALIVHIVILMLINLSFNKINKKYRIILFLITQFLCLLLYIAYLFICHDFNSKQLSNSEKNFIVLIVLFFCYLVSLTFWWMFFNHSEKINITTKEMLMFITFICAASLITQFNKYFFGRNRPNGVLEDGNTFFHALVPNFTKIRGQSFNSGHANSACLLLGFNYLFLRNKNVLWKIVCNVVIWIIIVLTSLSRVLIWAHWSTDVLFSIILNVFLYYSIYHIYNIKKKESSNG